MRQIKIIIALAASAFLVYRSLELLLNLLHTSVTELTPWEQVFVAVLFNLFITGIPALPGFILPTNKLIPAHYFTIQNPLKLSLVYNILKVELFRKMLMIFYWGRPKNRKKYFDGTRSGLANLNYQSLQSETGHFIAFLLVLTVMIILLTRGFIIAAGFGIALNVLVNLYPIILQRVHRLRINRLIP